ncbi:MAG: hypothetical protein ABIV10_08220, partial [Gemmatimonadaceae bacterium]
MPDPLALPEIARSLRFLGTPRDVTSESAHDAIFPPLLAARAASGDMQLALSSFAGEALAATIEARASAAAQVHATDPAQARARSAQAIECLERLRDELLRLDRLGRETRDRPADESRWERWIEQLRRVFMEADRACVHLSTVL